MNWQFNGAWCTNKNVCAVAFNPLKERKEAQELSAFKRQDTGLKVCKALERDGRNVLTAAESSWQARHIFESKIWIIRAAFVY